MSKVQKTEVQVELLCPKCRRKVMKLIAEVEGITSVALDPAKAIVTVIGEADPVKIIKMVRKHRKNAEIKSVGPPKVDGGGGGGSSGGGGGGSSGAVVPMIPTVCQKCEVWYVVGDDMFGYCSIL